MGFLWFIFFFRVHTLGYKDSAPATKYLVVFIQNKDILFFSSWALYPQNMTKKQKKGQIVRFDHFSF